MDTSVLPDRESLHLLRVLSLHMWPRVNFSPPSSLYLEHCFDDLLGNEKDGDHATPGLFCDLAMTLFFSRPCRKGTRGHKRPMCLFLFGTFSFLTIKLWRGQRRTGKMAVVRSRPLALCFSRFMQGVKNDFNLNLMPKM